MSTAWRLAPQHGRTVVVTGAGSGIGAATARALAEAGARVILAVRDLAKGRGVAATMAGRPEVRQLDLSDLAAVRRFVTTLPGDVDVLINNGGIMGVPYQRAAAPAVGGAFTATEPGGASRPVPIESDAPGGRYETAADHRLRAASPRSAGRPGCAAGPVRRDR
jgi:NAD(P)-dependent dehydrogenase (short-subunit alcohol dehydrogenase family)